LFEVALTRAHDMYPPGEPQLIKLKREQLEQFANRLIYQRMKLQPRQMPTREARQFFREAKRQFAATLAGLYPLFLREEVLSKLRLIDQAYERNRQIFDRYYEQEDRILEEQGEEALQAWQVLTRDQLYRDTIEISRETLIPANTSSWDRQYWELAFWVEECRRGIWSQLDTLSELLAQRPIYVQTGQLEPILDKPRLYSDVEAEIANELATLPRFTARCILSQDGQPHEYTIRTLPIPEASVRGVSTAALIKEQSRQACGKDRSTVEREIRDRLKIGPPRPVEDATIRNYEHPRPRWDDEDEILREEK
ncbi:MAG: hypothetical protein ACJ788_17520, partial [Ktedonobacteraceae bacterium]